MGRVDHKMVKFDIVATKTPGTEILRPECYTGDHGMTVDELAPFGVVGAVTPSTHPVPTLVNNAISLIAAGNACVFNAHPASRRVFAYAVEKLGAAIQAAGGPANLIACVREPTVESAQAMFAHPNVRVVLVTGGPAVVREALRAPKRAICAGPGNPPVVVDETACLRRAAKGIIEGGGFDNNILCIGEKEIFVVESVADALMEELAAQGCHRLNEKQVGELTRAAFPGEGRRRDLNREMIGRDAKELAGKIGISMNTDPPLLFGETEFDHPFVQYEQMMPFLPVVRCRDAREAIAMAIEAEHGYGHTAVIHSRNIQTMHEMAKRVNTTIFVKNGASTAGLGWGGEGHTSFSIAGPTGEGLTTARTFTRSRRCTLVDYFRIV
jgi:aldehyde dehydrogenase